MEYRDIDHIGVLGAGLMGHGIAQVFASAGFRVNIFDADTAFLKTAKDRIANNFKPFISLNLAGPEDVEKCLERVTLSGSMKALCDGPQVIIEAISEDAGAKKKVYAEMEAHSPTDTIFSSNTSALSITEIGSGLRHRERFLGSHFWNPPHIIPCVEVIMGAFTAADVFETFYSLMEKVNKVPVRVLQDVPGFLGNRLQHAMWREAIYLREKNIASAEDIDKVVKYGFGVRMSFIGPLETADLAGLNLTHDIEKYLFPYLNASTEPSPALEKLVVEGSTGVRAGKGFYDWTPEKIREIIARRDVVLLRILHEIVAEAKRG
ncbi:MAG: 3-hydroxyacyl-CoA dehydrogenase family protein [Syntrophaceae bacterium]|nr:3-hydroxyacyl-CoA dehydrogenase family protein [Syntrophaceae bacterium]